jgi:hypothetical protein
VTRLSAITNWEGMDWTQKRFSDYCISLQTRRRRRWPDWLQTERGWWGPKVLMFYTNFVDRMEMASGLWDFR